MKSPMVQAFAALDTHRSVIAKVPLRQRFAEDPERFRKFSLTASDILYDYSKNLVDEETMRLLFSVAESAEIEKHRSAMFSGEAINRTEKRPVLHVALRATPEEVYRAGGENVVPEVHAVLGRMADFANAVRDGGLAGRGGRFTDGVNIGFGGPRPRPPPAAPAV